MRWTGLVLAVALAGGPAVMAAQKAAGGDAAKQDRDTRAVTLRGCVVPGQDKGTYVLTHVIEVTPAGRSAIPDMAHGRKVVFWLDKQDEVLKHANAGVEVTGVITGTEESEIELKNGSRRDGGLIAEFEGPGKDVRVPNQVVAGAIGTSGRTAAEKDDIKTLLMKVQVSGVRAVDYSCRAQ